MAKRTFLMDLDMNKNQILNVTLQNLSTAPSTPTNGQFYYNTSTNLEQFYNGSAWVNVGQTLAQMNGEPVIVNPADTTKYWRGDKTFQTLNTSVVPELTNLY